MLKSVLLSMNKIVVILIFCVIFMFAQPPYGSEFRVNTYTANEQSFPSVSSLEGGGFVVVWMSSGSDGSNYGICGQIYLSNGVADGSEFGIGRHNGSPHSPTL
jgi:hypothetical protein